MKSSSRIVSNAGVTMKTSIDVSGATSTRACMEIIDTPQRHGGVNSEIHGDDPWTGETGMASIKMGETG